MTPRVRFVSATDAVWLATLDAIRDQLTNDGLEDQEGAFTACSFWHVYRAHHMVAFLPGWPRKATRARGYV